MRPRPPADMLEPGPALYRPAQDVEFWMRTTFLLDDGALANGDHAHLQHANIGVMWTSQPYRRHGVYLAALTESLQATDGGWKRGRREQQLEEWFGLIPDFLITFYANAAAEYDDASWCALVEHELYHCGQATNEFGAPRFKKDGTPMFALRAHDAEEFVGVIQRYGDTASTPGVQALITAASKQPTIARAHVHRVCGNCVLKVA